MSDRVGLENELRQLIKQELDSLYVPLREQNQALMDEIKALRRELAQALQQVDQ